jgi:ppGpp synthetase/RelA/SpoT-type nucleotidyltranferase
MVPEEDSNQQQSQGQGVVPKDGATKPPIAKAPDFGEPTTGRDEPIPSATQVTPERPNQAGVPASRTRTVVQDSSAKTRGVANQSRSTASSSNASDAQSRPTLSQFPIWMDTHLHQKLDDRVKRAYEVNTSNTKTAAERHEFFASLDAFLATCATDYKQSTGTNLFSGDTQLKLLTKSYESVVNKAFRLNIAWNKGFPKAPQNGWITPENWFNGLDDIVRTSLVCRYLDGPKFVASRLHERATALGLDSEYKSRQQDDGYYAYHFYISIPVDLIKTDWTLQSALVRIEVQLTTQLQDILRDLTHKFYETLRVQEGRKDDSWKWDFSTSRFKASYLSHTLHLIEGLIVELRRETLGKTDRTEE